MGETAIGRVSGPVPWLAPCALVVLALALAFGPVFLWHDPARMALGRADQWGYFGPTAFFMDSAIHRGEWPQWNPLTFCGTPFAANPQSALYYPPHLLRSLLNLRPTPMGTVWSLAAMQAAHLLLLAAGTWRLARAFGQRRLGAAVAAVAFMLGSAITFRTVQHWPFVANAAWLPWLLLLTHNALRAENRRACAKSTVLAGLVFGMTVLIGFPQLTIYLGICLGVFVALRVVLGRGKWRRRAGRAIGVLAVVGVLGALVAMPMLMPAREFSSFSARAKGAGAADSMVRPNPLNPLAEPAGLFKALTYYPGSRGIRISTGLVFLLALCAARSPRRRQALLWAVLLVAMLDLCLGPPWPLSWLADRVAPFALTAPERASLFASFALALLAGSGTDAVFRPARSRFGTRFWRVLGALVGGGVLWALLEWVWLDPEYRVTPWVWVCVAAGFAAMLLPGWPRVRRAVLVLALVLECALWTQFYVPFLAEDDPYPGDVAALHGPRTSSLDNTRGLGEAWLENAGMYRLAPVINGYDPLRVEAVRDFMCAPRLRDRYKRRVEAWELREENPQALALLSRRFQWASGGTEGVRIEEAGANSVRVALSGVAPSAELLFLETAYPGWRARVDGEPAPIVRARGVFQSVAIPEGAREVSFIFASRAVLAGLFSGLAALAAALTALCWTCFAPRPGKGA